jgi:hypothetical protein
VTNKKVSFDWLQVASSDSTMVEHSPHHPMIKFYEIDYMWSRPSYRSITL